MFEIVGIVFYCSPPSKSDNKNKEKSDWVDMGEWAWCQSTLKTRGRVSQSICHPCMSIFMERYTDDQYDSSEDKIKCYHDVYISKIIFFSVQIL
jgi:hypothetical protein